MTGTHTLYGRPGAGSLAAQLILAELHLPHRMVWVDDAMAATEEYRRLNPTGKIPTLILPDGTAMFESAAICLHLAGTDPAGGFAPAPGSADHAVYLQWMAYLATSPYGAALRYYYAARFTAGGEADSDKVQRQAAADFDASLALVEAALGPWLLGDRMTAADFYLWMLAGWHPEGDAAVAARFPKIAALCRRVAARPAAVEVLQAQG